MVHTHHTTTCSLLPYTHFTCYPKTQRKINFKIHKTSTSSAGAGCSLYYIILMFFKCCWIIHIVSVSCWWWSWSASLFVRSEKRSDGEQRNVPDMERWISHLGGGGDSKEKRRNSGHGEREESCWWKAAAAGGEKEKERERLRVRDHVSHGWFWMFSVWMPVSAWHRTTQISLWCPTTHTS